jgi:hypothetical protein
MPPASRDALAKRFAERAFSLGLAVTLPEGGERPIPPLLTPVVVDGPWLQSEVGRIGELTALIRQVTDSMLRGPERAEVLDGLFPFERECIEARGLPEVLAVVRADLFFEGGSARALELNATIPAMQGYSDAAVRAWLEAWAPELKLSSEQLEALIKTNGENTLALLAALRAYHRKRSGRELERIALIHRPQDAQLTELRYLARRWEREGIRATVAEASQLERRGDRVEISGQPIDLVYRHIFARRVEPSWGLAPLLKEPGLVPLTNAVAAPLEMKRTFAELSRCVLEPDLARRHGIDHDRLRALADLLPWTRPLRSGPTHDPDGKAVSNLLDEVAARPERYVIKRSWDYGGRAVFLGFEAELEVTRERSRQAFGEALHWPQLVQRAAADDRGGGFVVQERVRAEPAERLVCDAEGGAARWRTFFEDFSVYASLGLPDVPWGGVCRASLSAVVNIAGGGGVAPVLHSDVVSELERLLNEQSKAG